MTENPLNWERLEDDLFALYREALQPVILESASPDAFGRGVDPWECLLGLALHGTRADRESGMWPPQLSAHGCARSERPVLPTELARWKRHDLATPIGRRTELSRRLAMSADRAGRSGWSAWRASLEDCLFAVAARLDVYARRQLRVSPDFGVLVIDSPFGSQHAAAQVRRAVGDRGFHALFPRWYADEERRPKTTFERQRSRFAPPPVATSSMRRRWNVARRSLAAANIAPVISLLESAGVPPTWADAAAVCALVAEPHVDLETAIDAMVEAIDRGVTSVLNTVLHDPAFQTLEATWRSVDYLVQQIDFEENIQLELLNASSSDLQNDAERSREPSDSALHRHLNDAVFRSPRPEPYGLVVHLGAFGPTDAEIDTLEHLGRVAMQTQAIFVSNASDAMLGYTTFARHKTLQSIFDTDRYARWTRFREAAASRYVGMTIIRFRCRRPHEGVLGKSGIHFREVVQGVNTGPAWANPSVLLAGVIAAAFARERLCANIIGPTGGGQIHGLLSHQSDQTNRWAAEPWAEDSITSRREYELSEQGFIPWFDKYDFRHAYYYSANGCHLPRRFENTPEGKGRETDYCVGTQLPYQFIATRFAQYLMVVRLACFGALHERAELQRALTAWLEDFIENEPTAAPIVSDATLTLADIPDEPTWWAFRLTIRPAFKHMGARFTLSVDGRMER